MSIGKVIFPGCSKMPLPPPKRLRAGRQMQVEPCESPFAEAPEILMPSKIRNDAYVAMYAAMTKDEGNPAKRGTDGCFSAACQI